MIDFRIQFPTASPYPLYLNSTLGLGICWDRVGLYLLVAAPPLSFLSFLHAIKEIHVENFWGVKALGRGAFHVISSLDLDQGWLETK